MYCITFFAQKYTKLMIFDIQWLSLIQYYIIICVSLICSKDIPWLLNASIIGWNIQGLIAGFSWVIINLQVGILFVLKDILQFLMQGVEDISNSDDIDISHVDEALSQRDIWPSLYIVAPVLIIIFLMIVLVIVMWLSIRL